MDALVFTVPGAPRGKGRPRARNAGAFVQLYTDAKTVSYENLIKMAAVQALNGRAPLDCPLDMTVTIRFAPPASVSNRQRAAMLAGSILPAKKPDIDNSIKSIADSLNGIAYRDDAQIVGLYARKVYALTPGLDVRIARAILTQTEAAAA